MPASPLLPEDPELQELRAELRCILRHPAIAPARQQAAQLHIQGCADAVRLRHWLALAVGECSRWEEQVLAHEVGNSR